jgi:type IV pilus assembly protein PilV
MLNRKTSLVNKRGASMIEVLVTIVILAFGLLGLAGMQIRVQVNELESYQRAQALVLLGDMAERIKTNAANAPNYVSVNTFGTGSAAATCAAPTVAADVATYDQCEWGNLLKGAAEVKGSTQIGAMEGARGCITQAQAADPAAGVCAPAIYQVAVAWQGQNATVVPSVTCGTGSYGTDDALRRVIATRVSVPILNCN